MNHITWLSLGPGILWSEGAMHQRHRKVMNPAFSTSHLRTFIPLFQRATSKVLLSCCTLAPKLRLYTFADYLSAAHGQVEDYGS